MKQHIDETAHWWNSTLMKQQAGETASWWNSKLVKQQAGETTGSVTIVDETTVSVIKVNGKASW